MKQFFTTLLLLSSFLSYSQDDASCYQKYAKVFEMRGAKDIPDGTYEEVIVTIRKGSFSDCLIGKVKVKDGLIVTNSISLSFVDGTFEPLRRSYKSDEAITITNGISKTLLTVDEELINVMFVNAIKPKKKAFKKAPEPDFDLY